MKALFGDGRHPNAVALEDAVIAAGGSKAPCGTVNLAVNPWVGYEADAAVVSYILTNQLGYTVTKKNIVEQVSWQGFETGEVDEVWEAVVLERLGHLADAIARDGERSGAGAHQRDALAVFLFREIARLTQRVPARIDLQICRNNAAEFARDGWRKRRLAC